MTKKNINIHEFYEQFKKEYKFLYENYDRVAGFDEAVDAFDEFIQHENGINFVREFNRYREDIISSDREAGAFMFAFEALGGFE